MGIELFGPNDAKRWDDIVKSSVNGTLYHSWDWLKIVEKHSGSKLYPIVYLDNNRPFGAIPLFHQIKYGIKMVFSPPPGSAITLGPVLISQEYKQHKFELAYLDFQANIDSFINQIGSHYTYILTSPGLLDVRPFMWANYQIVPSYTYLIDLTRGTEAIWNDMSKYLKKNIKSAQKKGVQIIESHNFADISYVYDSLKKRYSQQNLNLFVQENYLKDVMNKFGNTSIKTWLAVFNQENAGALVCNANKDTLSAWIGAVRNESNDLEANELLHWEAISSAVRNEYKWFEILGANRRNLCEFKARFCPSVSISFHLYKKSTLGKAAEKAYALMQKKYF